jgi:hypothetical protein
MTMRVDAIATMMVMKVVEVAVELMVVVDCI